MNSSKLALSLALSFFIAANTLGCSAAENGTSENAQGSEQDLHASDSRAVQAIKNAIVDAEYTSESDSPFRYVDGAAPSSNRVSAAAVKSEFSQAILQEAQTQSMPVVSFATSRSFSFDGWFDAHGQDPENPDTDPAQVAYYANLQKMQTALKAHLTGLRVYRFGPGINPRSHEVLGPEVLIVIAGKLPSGKLAAVFAFSVET